MFKRGPAEGRIKKMLFKILKIILIDILALFLTPEICFAVCPTCTLAVGAGVGFSRWLGIDDLITGLWLGAFLASLSFWLRNFLKSRKKDFKGSEFVFLVVLFALMTFLPLYYAGFVGHPENKFFGIDKLILGSIFGSIVFVFSAWLENFLRKKHQGKVYFYYQKVIIPVALLLIVSIILQFTLCKLPC